MTRTKYFLALGLGTAALMPLSSLMAAKKGAASPAPAKKAAKADSSLASEMGKISYTRFEVIFKKGSETEDAYTRFKKMEAIRTQAQGSLERLMKQRPHPELSVRYAELILQRGRDQESFGLELEMADNTAEAQRLKDSSRKLLRAGLAMHEKVLKGLNNDNLKAEVYLGMSRTERSLGTNERALAFASKGLELGSKIPAPIRMRLYMASGDASFDMARANEALRSYRSAQPLAPENGLERAYLDYKIAWSLFNLKDPVAAIASLRKLIDQNQDRFALKQEAIRDYGLMASDLGRSELEAEGGVRGIYRYLRKSSDSDLPEKAVERMAKTFASNGRRQDAIDAMMLLIEEKPKDRANVDRALMIVDWEKDLTEKWKLRDRYMWILSNFGPETTWFRGLEHDAQMVARKRIEESIRSYATNLHKEAQGDGVKESRDEKLMIVARLYDAHLKAFSEEPRIYFYRAEIHRHFDEWADAGTKYDRYLSLIKLVDKDDLSAFDKKTKGEVLESSVAVWEKAAKADPKHNDKLLAAADNFVSENPKDARAPKVLYSAAEKSFNAKNPTAAMIRLERIIKEYPKTEVAEDAVNAALDMFNKEGDWVNLATRARAWLDTVDVWAPKAGAAKVTGELKGILAKTELKACEELSKKSDRYLEAALCFESFAKGFANDAFAPKALFQASELYQKSQRPTAELDVLEDLVKKYPKSPEAEKAFGTLATVYEKNFLFERAAEIYEVLVSRPNLKNRDLFLERLLALLQGIGEREKLQKWLKDPMVKPALRRQILSVDYREMLSRLREEELATGYDKGDFVSAEARDVFKRLEKAMSDGELEFHQVLDVRRYKGNLWREKGKLAEADKEWMIGLKAFWAKKDRSDLDWESAARLRLDQASFWVIPFEGTNLKANPQKKVELFTKLEAWYAEVIGMKSPTVALEALWKSSQLYANFAKELDTLPETKAQAGELARKSKLALEQLASRARDWKLMSPAILAAIESTRVPVAGATAAKSLKAEFPWQKLPLWIETNEDWAKWSEWKDSRASLESQLAKGEDRKQLRRAALVLVTRDANFAYAPAKTWISTLGDKSSIQVRVQALVNSKSLQLANLYLDQYQELFGKDAFVSYVAGQIMWARGDYRSAYDYWVRKNSFDKDFHSVYWKMGWDYAFANLGSADPRPLAGSAFDKLQAQSTEAWQKVYLVNLCLKNYIVCPDKFSFDTMQKVLASDVGEMRQWQPRAGDSAFSAKLDAVDALFSTRVAQAKDLTELKPYKELLPIVWDAGAYALSRDEVRAQHQRLKTLLDKKQSEIEQRLKNDLLVTSKAGTSS
ncbi:MAG TPA: tetratricopeptide repeat protein [Bdellovibrionota bacterium]|jgi:outer membrane protein assembly factor BamD (BamD/ComL family)|nr:tetratricopeptide repeat protein [Bdellovibrionota bacterium]